jgi:AGCS family alanine or glycine:cation symporter
MAHARNGVLNPASSGLLGMLEVWFDTGFLCMLTAFSILLSVPGGVEFTDGMSLVMYAAGSVFGSFGKIGAMLSVVSFAFATVICWYYYGMESWSFIFGKRTRIAFLPLFLSFVFFGCFFDTRFTVFAVDLFMSVVTVLCVSALIKNSDRIKTLSEKGGVIECDPTLRYIGKIKGSVLRKGEKRRDR